MIVTTKGLPLRIDRRTCREAVKFYGTKLLSSRLFETIDVVIKFDPKIIGRKESAYCQVKKIVERPRSFIITINPQLSRRNTLICLAHETVHVKQYAEGRMKDYANPRYTKWLGQKVEFDEANVEDYFMAPWEIEARGYEFGLYTLFRCQSQYGVDGNSGE